MTVTPLYYNYMNLTFHTEPFDIPDEYKITLWRFNDGNASPFTPKQIENVKWDIDAKSVTAEGVGVFCIQGEQILMSNTYFNFAFFAVPDATFMKIEADKKDVIYVDFDEISISRGNIVEVMGRGDFGKKFPIFSYIYSIINSGRGLPSYLEASAKMSLYIKQMERSGDGVFSGADGFPHSVRVEKGIHLLGNKMGIKKRERETIKGFAYWHDVMRANGTSDPEHGKRVADAIERGREMPRLAQTDIDRLIFACEHHSTMLRSDDPLIDICFDADRLDLMMIGDKPDPAMMATDIGAYYAEHYDEYSVALKNISI